MIGLRVTEEEITALDEQAVDEGLVTKAGDPNRSELIRIMVEYARQHMPAGWRPEGWEYRG
ncbi:hypothetical protein [Nocardia beijingensis]|uniref:hypothetical protein n=1 Tax=Nocardia beijingensis TaxID=95162 RepID=UPI001895E51E|nr:hypothetical protein [Nocardia beijingensis]MBF6074277.1 hypothetical protein [Nocardia beijingensis]